VAKQRLTRKEMRQPDHLISFSVQMADWVKNHVKVVLYSCAGVVLIIGLIIAWSAAKHRQYQQAETFLYEALKLTKTTENTDDPSGREKAAVLLQNITLNYASTPAAALASWHLGHLHFSQKDYAKALTAYQQARKRLHRQSESSLPTLITLNIAYALESTQACPEAIANFETVLQSSAQWLREAAYLGIGRCYESLGAKDQALAAYQRALAEDASEAFRRSVEERVRFLEASKKS
jgi:predicted negative regulator of RcsB-dependent stress response